MPGSCYLWKSHYFYVWSILKSLCQHCHCPASTAGRECHCHGHLLQFLVVTALRMCFLLFPYLIFLDLLGWYPLLCFKLSLCFVDAVFVVGWWGTCCGFCVAPFQYKVLNTPSRFGEVLVWALRLGCCVPVSVGHEWWKLYESREGEGLTCAPTIEEISVARQSSLDLWAGELKGWWSHPQ